MKAFLKWFMALLADPHKPVVRVIVFGAVGGVLAVMAGMVQGELKPDWYLALLLFPCLALGAGAAFAAVFVLLGIKTEDVWRCCGVALLAGFFWRPVFEAGKDYLLNADDRAAAAESAKVTKTLETTLGTLATSTNSSTNTFLIEQAGTLAETLTSETGELRRGSLKTRAQFAIIRAMDVLADHADKGRPAAVAAAAKVVETAATTGTRSVADKAWVHLTRVPVVTNAQFEAKKQEIRSRLTPLR
jgi:hypothetical protein